MKFIARSDVIIEAPNNMNVAHCAFEITESTSHNIWSIDDVTYSLQSWSKLHPPRAFQLTVQSILAKTMFTNLHPFISTSIADPLISTWSQISNSKCTILDIFFVKENNVHLVQTTIKHVISNNPELLLVSIWIPLDSFHHILHNPDLSLLQSSLPPTWTLDMFLFKSGKFGDAMNSYRFGLFLFGTINTKWNWDS